MVCVGEERYTNRIRMAINLPNGIKRREVIDKSVHFTPKEKAYSFINGRIIILEEKLKHESFMLPRETFAEIQEEIDIYKRLLREI